MVLGTKSREKIPMLIENNSRFWSWFYMLARSQSRFHEPPLESSLKTQRIERILLLQNWDVLVWYSHSESISLPILQKSIRVNKNGKMRTNCSSVILKRQWRKVDSRNKLRPLVKSILLYSESKSTLVHQITEWESWYEHSGRRFQFWWWLMGR